MLRLFVLPIYNGVISQGTGQEQQLDNVFDAAFLISVFTVAYCCQFSRNQCVVFKYCIKLDTLWIPVYYLKEYIPFPSFSA